MSNVFLRLVFKLLVYIFYDGSKSKFCSVVVVQLHLEFCFSAYIF
jgi:hypothetical protein